MQMQTKSMQTTKFSEFIISRNVIFSAMEKKGINSVSELANILGVHRNALHPYLNGKRALSNTLEKLLSLLDISPAEVLLKKVETRFEPAMEIAPLLSKLCAYNSETAFFLFGSRARGKGKKYSDYDVGVFREGNFDFADFSKLLDEADAWNQERSYDVQLTNLCYADERFLKQISKDIIFIGGNYSACLALQKKLGVVTYG